MFDIKNYTKISILGLFMTLQVHSETQNFDIGAPIWLGTFPGAGTYDQTLGSIHVTGVGERIFDVVTDPTAVYSGNDNPVQTRNYSYNFPAGSTVSIDFSHITRYIAPGKSFDNVKGIPKESVGNFSVPVTSSVLAVGHTLVNGNTELLGNDPAVDETVSTLTWVNISNLSFDIATNGVPAFVAHKNMVVTVPDTAATTVPSSSTLSLIILSLFLLGFVFFRQQNSQ